MGRTAEKRTRHKNAVLPQLMPISWRFSKIVRTPRHIATPEVGHPTQNLKYEKLDNISLVFKENNGFDFRGKWYIHAINSYGRGWRSTTGWCEVRTRWAGRGPTGSRLRLYCFPPAFASFRFSSFSFTRLRNSRRHLLGRTCSTRTLMRLGMMRFLSSKTGNQIPTRHACSQ